ncbi:hypothetical protein PI124_g24481 [Phytophthora idaei]|nr:hypothetical protein PI124_g24481 [Phytophthora idaei]
MAKGSSYSFQVWRSAQRELKSGRDGSTPCSRLRAFNKTPAPEPGAAAPETATLSSGLSGATKSLSRNLATELDDVAGPDPDYDNFNDGTEGSKPSVASAKRSALLNAPRPPINGDTLAAKHVFDRVEALMKNDEWMQLFKPIPKRKAD